MNSITADNDMSRGSEWGIWDLQIQTILDDRYEQLKTYYSSIKSADQKNWELFTQKVGGEDCALLYDSKEYFSNTKINLQERYANYVRTTFAFLEIFKPYLKLIGITDHNYYDDFLLDEFYNYSLKATCKVLCGLEISINGTHLLVFFEKPPYAKQKFSEGIKTFLTNIGVANPKKDAVLTISSKSIIDDVIPLIISLNGIYIFPHCNSENGLFQECSKTDRTYLSEIFNNKSRILLQFQSKDKLLSTSNYIASNPSLYRSRPISTIASDGRSLKSFGSPDKDGYFLWIKSNPTFEGFRQILYEPDERIKIQEVSPDSEYKKSFFSNLAIADSFSVFHANEKPKFSKCKIPLNRNMVAIIGGRGAGKSVLIDFMANGFKFYKQKNEEVFSLDQNFGIEWEKSSGELERFTLDNSHDLSFLYISQSEVKEIVRDSKELGEQIKKILNIENLTFSLSVSEKIQITLTDYYSLCNWFAIKDEKGRLINSRSFVDEEINRNQNLLDRITTKDNKEKLTEYTENISTIQKNENAIVELDKIKEKLQTFEAEINSDIRKIDKQIPLVEFTTQINEIDSLINRFNEIIKEKLTANGIIKDEFKDYSGDLSSLLGDVEIFKTQLVNLDQKKVDIEERENKLNKFIALKNSFGDLIKTELENQKQKINEAWVNLLQGNSLWSNEQNALMKTIIENREINIEGMIVFDKKEFYSGIQEYLDGRGFKNKSDVSVLESFFEVTDMDSFVTLIDVRLSNLINDNPTYFYQDKRYDIEKYFYDLEIRNNYLFTQPKITYKNKTLDKLSAGQRGTLYLCLKLATKAFSEPIIFDQPEDDLDNEFIITELVDIFKKIKKYRQVIIVTHNANLVVNSDVEQVIVAQNDDEVLSYYSGALENPRIIESVCRILEGGKDAFDRRKNKYQYIR